MEISIGTVARVIAAPTRKGFGPVMPVYANKKGPTPNPAEMAVAYKPMIRPRLFGDAI